SLVVEVPFDLFRKFLSVFWQEQFPPGQTWEGTFPFPGGFLIGGLMVVNLLAAHALRVRLPWERSGIILIHSGLLLLFLGEFMTRMYAVEQQMAITEGSSANYAEDTRNEELAFIDSSDPTKDKVVVLARNRLRDAKPGERITHED